MNADNAIANTGKSAQGYNLFTYCFNNPVNIDDQTGNWPQWLEKTIKVVTENMNNIGKPKEQQKSSREIINDSLKSAAIGAAMSTMTAGINFAVKDAVSTKGVGLMPELTPGFGEMMKGFFGSVDDAFVYMSFE